MPHMREDKDKSESLVASRWSLGYDGALPRFGLTMSDGAY